MRANMHMFARTELHEIERLVSSQGEKLALSDRRYEARLGGVEEGLERASQRRRLMNVPWSVAEDVNMAMGAGPSSPIAAALPATAGAIVPVTPAIAAPRAVTDALVNVPSRLGNAVTETAPILAKMSSGRTWKRAAAGGRVRVLPRSAGSEEEGGSRHVPVLLRHGHRRRARDAEEPRVRGRGRTHRVVRGPR